MGLPFESISTYFHGVCFMMFPSVSRGQPPRPRLRPRPCDDGMVVRPWVVYRAHGAFWLTISDVELLEAWQGRVQHEKTLEQLELVERCGKYNIHIIRYNFIYVLVVGNWFENDVIPEEPMAGTRLWWLWLRRLCWSE